MPRVSLRLCFCPEGVRSRFVPVTLSLGDSSTKVLFGPSDRASTLSWYGDRVSRLTRDRLRTTAKVAA